MRTILAALALSILSTSAIAAPKHHRKPKHESKWMRDCITERTGPDGGVSRTEARKLCKAEEPEDEVEGAKAALALAKGNAKVAKAMERARKALIACGQAVTDRCVDSADPAGGTDCNIDPGQGLFAEYQFVCLGLPASK